MLGWEHIARELGARAHTHGGSARRRTRHRTPRNPPCAMQKLVGSMAPLTQFAEWHRPRPFACGMGVESARAMRESLQQNRGPSSPFRPFHGQRHAQLVTDL